MIGFRRFLSVATVAFSVFAGGAARADDPLRLVTFRLPPFVDLTNSSAPGFSIEVLKQVFAAMGRDVTFEGFPITRAWSMVLSGQRDGILITQWTSEGAMRKFWNNHPRCPPYRRLLLRQR